SNLSPRPSPLAPQSYLHFESAFAGVAAGDARSHAFGESAHQRESETDSLARARELALAAIEGLEDLAEVARRHTGAAVADANRHVALLAATGEGDALVRRLARVLERVVDQVAEHLHERVALETHRRQVVVDGEVELEAALA